MYTSKQSMVICKHIPLLKLPLCPDQSHLKGFPLPIQASTTGSVVYLLLYGIFFHTGLAGLFIRNFSESWREILGSLQPGDSQWTRKQRLHRGSVNCIWRRGGKRSGYHSFGQIDPISKHSIHTHIRYLSDIYIHLEKYSVSSTVAAASFLYIRWLYSFSNLLNSSVNVKEGGDHPTTACVI